jgi:4-amino-4-deoxy-L-arabinose transferase-like glycosyltransferase
VKRGDTASQIVFVFDHDPPKAKEPTDYTGLKIVAILAPVFLLFVFLGNADMGLTVCIVLGVTILAIGIRRNWRKHLWFWATIAFILALHIPLFFFVRWPQGKPSTIVYTMPIGIADFLIISGVLGLAEKFFSNSSLQ